MNRENKLRLAWWIVFPVAMVIVRLGDGGRIWNYMVDHLWLTALLPLVVLFVALFARVMQYRGEPEASSKVNGAHGAKP